MVNLNTIHAYSEVFTRKRQHMFRIFHAHEQAPGLCLKNKKREREKKTALYYSLSSENTSEPNKKKLYKSIYYYFKY